MANPDDWIYDDLDRVHQRALKETVTELKEGAKLVIEDYPVVAGVLRDNALQLENAFGFECNPVNNQDTDS